MDEVSEILDSEQATQALGAALGDALRTGDIVLLSGPLGAGKTTLARAVIQRRCGVAAAPSPTFTLVETYPGDDLAIWHFDFYRLKRPDEAWELGVEEAFTDGASLIEWPERAPSIIPASALTIVLSVENGRRTANMKAPACWRARLQTIAERVKNQPRDPS